MPARHTSLQDGLLLEADFNRWLWSTKEGVGETSGQTAGSYFSKSSLLVKPVWQKKQAFFVRCGSLGIRNFTGAPKPHVRSGPDVFADALVPNAGPDGTWRANSQQFRFVNICRPADGSRLRLSPWRPAVVAMVIALPNGRVNRIPRSRYNPRQSSIFAIPQRPARAMRSHSIHRDI
jgi:hypothetical protein